MRSYMKPNATCKLIETITNDSGVKPKLYPTPSDEEAVNGYRSQPYLTIAPASVWFTKQYPKEKWIDFIQKIPAQYSVYLLGAPEWLHAALRRDHQRCAGPRDPKPLRKTFLFYNPPRSCKRP